MKKQFIVNLLITVVSVSPIAYLFFVWDSIPETYVFRFELNDTFEKVQSRSALLTAVIVLSLAAALLYLLMRYLTKVDPKVNETTPTSTFHKLGFVITLFLIIINYFFILSAQYALMISTSVALAFLGLLITFIGNYMNNLKPNYIVGIRLPWTLSDPENWRKTHQMAGKLWFTGGVLLIVLSFVLPGTLLRPFMIIMFVVLTVIPGIYSYRMFRKKII